MGAMQTNTAPAPTADADRIALLDALRGFALAGIFLINLGSFSGLAFMKPEERSMFPTAAVDGPAMLLILWLAYGKFYSLFSLLFGIGFSLQLGAAERRGDARLRVFRRRLAVLLGFGAVHMYFWEGDILFFYALMGFLLIPLRRLSDRALVRTAAVLLICPVGLQVLIALSHGALDPGAWLMQTGERVLVRTGFAHDAMPWPLLRDAGWGDYLRFQISGPFFRYGELLSTGRPFKVLAMFLLGLWVGRSGLLSDVAPWAPLLRRIRAWGFTVGLPAAAAHAALMIAGGPGDRVKIAEAAAYALGVAPLALAYAATFALLWLSPGWRHRLERLAPAGRMALTNYLSQTCIAITLFFGIGLGLMGRVGPSLFPALVIAVLTAQVIVSRWWLSHYAFGPMEWLWRQATYGRRLPLRRPDTVHAPL
jgi:uncharacterized protein